MKSSRQLAVVLSIIAVMPAVPAGLAFVKDPYQIIRPRAGGELRLRSNTRFQNAGLIRNFLGDPEQGFDTIIMGASHAAEYRPSEIRSAIGINRAMNLSMVGGRPQVQLAVMRRALREPTVKKVIWSLSHSWMKREVLPFNPRHVFPAHLYQGGSIHRYLFNFDIAILSLENALGRNLPNRSLDTYNSQFKNDDWFHKTSDRYWEESLASRFRPSKLRKLSQTDPKPPANASFPNLDLLQQTLVEHPDVSFDLVLPPHPAILYASLQPSALADFLASRRRLTEIADSLKNVRLFAFDDIAWITTDLGLFRDAVHFHPNVSRFILESIGGGNGQLTSESMARHNETWLALQSRAIEDAIARPKRPSRD